MSTIIPTTILELFGLNSLYKHAHTLPHIFSEIETIKQCLKENTFKFEKDNSMFNF